MNHRLVAVARQVLYYALFASTLRRRNSGEAARRSVVAWSTSCITGLLAEARAVAVDAREREVVEALAGAVARVASADDAARRAPTREMVARARELLEVAVGPRRGDRIRWRVDRAAEMVLRLALSVASLALLVALVFTSAMVRGVVLQSSAGLWSFAAFFGVVGAVVTGMRPLGVSSFWSPLARPPGEWAKAWPPAAAVRQVLLRFAALFAGFALALGVILLAAPAEASFRTPFVVTTALCVMLMFGHGLDTWDYFDPRPVRFLVVLAGLVAVWAGLGYAPDSPWLAVPDAPDDAPVSARAPWVTADQWPHPGEGPVVVVAASGGGSRAAIFASSALLALDREAPPVSAAIQALSGVSGGSLAMSGYVALRLGRVDAQGYRAAMEADYLWPLLRAIVTGRDRARAVESDWNRRLSLRGVTLASLARAWRGGARQVPLPVLNSADMLGHPVLLSPFAPSVFALDDREACREASGEGEAWVCDRDAAHTLQELAQGMDVPMLSAARASANFPMAFPLIPVRAARPLTGHEHLADTRATRITDGGVFLNSGLQGLYPLLLRRREALRRRGVLLVLLDASATEAFSALPGEWEIMSALKGADVGRSQMLHRLMLSRLTSELGGRFGCVLVDMLPTALSRIPTSWHLDRGARSSLRQHFGSPRWTRQREQLQEAFAAVAAGRGGLASTASCFARPPLF